MRPFCILMTVGVLLGVTMTTVISAEKIELRYKFTEDQPLLYHHAVESHQTVTNRFNSTPQELDLKISNVVRVLPVEEKEDFGFQVRLESIRDPLEEVLERLKAGKPIEAGEFTEELEQFLISPLGKVRIDEKVDVADQNEKPEPERSSSNGSLLGVLQMIYVQLPEKPVTKGESWTIQDRSHDVTKKMHSVPDQPARVSSAESNRVSKLLCTSLGPMECQGRTVIKVEFSRQSSGTVISSQSYYGNMSIPIAISNYDVNESLGYFLFDPEAGKIIALELSEETQVNIMTFDRIFDLVMYEESSSDPSEVIKAKSKTTLELLP
ncbi:hypothetical protein Pla110_13220 [Polystyrenella longa]|uniref:Uncharacterized protein n=1 Tax=Polystyrenella longa TaxID=2528007 RepID=A0A518CK61_9PLAN|nr:hypothetical protein [Polystyrenella longa]QDU79611.1 hypothetical protein Pla110_13220 [Polystyrenella longa]